MRYLVAALIMGGIGLCVGPLGLCDNLDDASSSADSAYDYASKAPNTGNLEDARYRSRQAASATADARDAALDARAYKAADYEDRAYDYSRKAATARTDKDAQFYSTQAAKAAKDAQSLIDSDVAKRQAAKTK